jgi:predicted AAA+ superfamily ATPase
MPYRPRVIDDELRLLLSSAGAVLLEGPKGVGKTEAARQQAKSEVLLDLDSSARAVGDIDSGLLLAGEVPRLLDEWQLVPSLWNQVRRAVDARRVSGQFILTGSAVPADDVTRHTGAGRIARLRVRPMSLFELAHSSGGVSLRALLNGGTASAPDTGLTVSDVAELVCTGGWPLNLGMATTASLRALRSYLEDVQRTDIQRVDGVSRDPARVARVLRAYARHVATEASTSTIAADLDGATGAVHRDTLSDYLTALERLLIIEEQPAWAPHLRSRARVRNAGKRHFVDPSLAVAALRASPEHLLKDPALFGTLFESLVVRDLRVYGQACDTQVLHYRDNTGLEVDVVIEGADGRWAALKVKLGSGSIDAAAASLLRFRQKVDTDRAGPPAFLAVVTASGYAYVRPDGVQVIPIGTLGP